jgi:hypothetical protein
LLGFVAALLGGGKDAAMFLFLHGLALMFSLFMGIGADSGLSAHGAGGGGGAIAGPADGGGNMPGH